MLASLQPAHAPATPGWWPPAAGYWLALAAALAVVWLAWQRRISRRGASIASLAAAELQCIAERYRDDRDDRAVAIALSRWLRKVALLAHPPSAAITGVEWLAFLDRINADDAFSNGAGKIFASQVYSASPQADGDELLRLCRRWLQRLEPTLARLSDPSDGQTNRRLRRLTRRGWQSE